MMMMMITFHIERQIPYLKILASETDGSNIDGDYHVMTKLIHFLVTHYSLAVGKLFPIML